MNRILSGPTDKQRAILEYIVASLQASGYPPTFMEIAAYCGYKSQNSVSCHLHSLVRKGLITLGRGKSRALSLTDEGRQTISRASACTGD